MLICAEMPMAAARHRLFRHQRLEGISWWWTIWALARFTTRL